MKRWPNSIYEELSQSWEGFLLSFFNAILMIVWNSVLVSGGFEKPSIVFDVNA